MNIAQHREKLLREYPDYITAADVGRMLEIDATSVKRHRDRIKHINVEGVTLYHKADAARYASSFIKQDKMSRIAFYGIDVERIQAICEGYYRTHLDKGNKELLKLAKKVAKL